MTDEGRDSWREVKPDPSIFAGIERAGRSRELLGPFDFDRALVALRSIVEQARRIEGRRLARDEQLESAREREPDPLERLSAHRNLMEIRHQSVFEDVALSYAIIGCLAPFYEGLFKTGFHRLWQRARKETKERLRQNCDVRWSAPGDKWPDPAKYVGSDGILKDDICRGVEQVLTAFEIRSAFPTDTCKVFKALFAFRNKAFHNGFEWPPEERDRFQATVTSEGWGTWFLCVMDGSGPDAKPWLFYPSEEFIQICLDRAQRCLDGFADACSVMK